MALDELPGWVKQLEQNLGSFKGDLTIADASSRSGLSLYQAEKALFGLLKKYPGDLKATERGELIFSFPEGIQKERGEKSFFEKLWDKIAGFTEKAMRFLIRYWITAVIIFYALAFVAIAIALVIAAQNSDSDIDIDLGDVFGGIFRLVAEALYWSYHPFSPFNVGYGRSHRHGRRKSKDGIPFYEKVNRFVFGEPEPEKPAPEIIERALLKMIRARAGRIGVLDLMKATGISKKEAQATLARLMTDYEGDVYVDDETTGIVYEFKELRKTVERSLARDSQQAIWHERVKEPKITGNKTGDNWLVGGVNVFNLAMSTYVMTLASQAMYFDWSSPITWLLGVVPALFSGYILWQPIKRWLGIGKKQREVETENGRRGLLKLLLSDTVREKMLNNGTNDLEFTRQSLMNAWKHLNDKEVIDEDAFEEELIRMGAETKMKDNGTDIHYVFRDLEAEVEALNNARKNAIHEEIEVGETVFSSS